jgi:hypothetical protein
MKLCDDNLALMIVAVPLLAQEISVKCPIFVGRKANFPDVGNAMRKRLVAAEAMPIVLDEEQVQLWILANGREEITKIIGWLFTWGPYSDDGDSRSWGGIWRRWSQGIRWRLSCNSIV